MTTICKGCDIVAVWDGTACDKCRDQTWIQSHKGRAVPPTAMMGLESCRCGATSDAVQCEGAQDWPAPGHTRAVCDRGQGVPALQAHRCGLICPHVPWIPLHGCISSSVWDKLPFLFCSPSPYSQHQLLPGSILTTASSPGRLTCNPGPAMLGCEAV